ncbi:MAG: hypothetical protein KatS3mg108_3139 [Isosphaeraceae bacterium]|jgi:hypothetical protein|nr:MAG: hypothetical protein KatS3mg108_3139 [Isosphaeraceae bacterium]
MRLTLRGRRAWFWLLLACCAAAQAQQEAHVTPATPPPYDATDVPLSDSVSPAGPLAPPQFGTLDAWLDLDDSPIDLFGWIQNSYTATPGFEPADGSTVTVFPNRLANAWQGNQYYLVVRKATREASAADLGLRWDILFGNDWLFTKSFGLFDGAFTPGGFAGVDFPQLFAELSLPLRPNLRLHLQGGRFYSPAGFESPMAVYRPLLSVPYLLNFTPFTYLGALSRLELGDRLTLFQGAVNGGDRWFNAHYQFSFLGGLGWTSRSGRASLTSLVLVGPNQLPFFPAVDFPTLPVGAYTSPTLQNRRNPLYSRSTLVYHSTVASYLWGRQRRWKQAVEAFLVTQGNVIGFGPEGQPGRISYYGGAHWLIVEFNPRLSGVSRIEVFADPYGFVLPAPATYYEMTHGLIYKPSPNLWLRPEIRWDWAPGARPYDDGTRTAQLTLAVDLIVLF